MEAMVINFATSNSNNNPTILYPSVSALGVTVQQGHLFASTSQGRALNATIGGTTTGSVTVSVTYVNSRRFNVSGRLFILGVQV